MDPKEATDMAKFDTMIEEPIIYTQEQFDDNINQPFISSQEMANLFGEEDEKEEEEEEPIEEEKVDNNEMLIFDCLFDIFLEADSKKVEKVGLSEDSVRILLMPENKKKQKDICTISEIIEGMH